MTVGELIQKLADYPKDWEVGVHDNESNIDFVPYMSDTPDGVVVLSCDWLEAI